MEKLKLKHDYLIRVPYWIIYLMHAIKLKCYNILSLFVRISSNAVK